MDVRCEQCGTEYEFDQNRVGQQGVTVKCTQCGNVFKVHRPDRRRRPLPRGTTTLGAGPEGREWLVRRPDGQMVAFRELTTLQKWIVEGRIGRDDEISKNGETWKRLGNILELEPFFSVYEKAQALNRMVEQGAQIPAAPARGSDVLSSFHPVAPASNPANPPLAGPPPSLYAGPRSGPTSSIALKPLSSQINPVLPPPPTPPGIEPAMASRQVHPRVADARPVKERNASSLGADVDSGNAFGSSAGLPGPAALDSSDPPPAPAAFGTSSLDIPDQVMGTDPVAEFQRSRRRGQWALALVVLTFVGIGIGAALAAYGPKDNPLSELAARYGIRRAESSAEALAPKLEEAQRALDKDTEESRRNALALLATLYRENPKDPVIAPWRAFAAAITARSLERAIDDLGDGQGAQAAQRIATKRARMSRLVTQAGDWLRAVQNVAPDQREVRLAEAAVALAQGKLDAARQALEAIATAEPTHDADPLWLHLMAATTAASADATPEALEGAQTRLQKAVAARPSLVRAHVLLARVTHRLGDTPQARSIIDTVLKRVPDHEEALQLEKAWAPPPAPPPPPPPPREKTFEEWLQTADRLRQRDKTTAALNAYGRAAELQPSDARPEIGKGWCLLDLDKPNVALVSFTKAQKTDPENPEAYYGLAESHRALGHPEEAVSAYEEYLARAPAETPERRAVQRTIAELKQL